MKIAEENYIIWNNESFTIEAKIDSNLWNINLINDFQKNLHKVLYYIYKNSDITILDNKNLISLYFSGDIKIIELNNLYRKINLPTNVLSFPSYSKYNNILFLGDIIFSIDTISREVKRDKKSFNNHLIHLFIHGVLHLLGYDHQTNTQAKKMESLEIGLLHMLNIDNPYN